MSNSIENSNVSIEDSNNKQTLYISLFIEK